LAGAFELEKNQGVLVAEVAEESAAEEAGLRAGDVILSIEGQPVRSTQEFHNYEGQFPVGEKLSLAIVRNGSKKNIKVSVEQLKVLEGSSIDYRLQGARFEELPLKQRPDRVTGILLSELEPDSRLARQGLRPGDIITGCNRMATRDLAEFQEVVSTVAGSLYLQIRRGSRDYVVRMD